MGGQGGDIAEDGGDVGGEEEEEVEVVCADEGDLLVEFGGEGFEGGNAGAAIIFEAMIGGVDGVEEDFRIARGIEVFVEGEGGEGFGGRGVVMGEDAEADFLVGRSRGEGVVDAGAELAEGEVDDVAALGIDLAEVGGGEVGGDEIGAAEEEVGDGNPAGGGWVLEDVGVEVVGPLGEEGEVTVDVAGGGEELGEKEEELAVEFEEGVGNGAQGEGKGELPGLAEEGTGEDGGEGGLEVGGEGGEEGGVGIGERFVEFGGFAEIFQRGHDVGLDEGGEILRGGGKKLFGELTAGLDGGFVEGDDGAGYRACGLRLGCVRIVYCKRD